MKILLIGGAGQLGSDILRNNTAHDILAPERSALDLEHPAGIAAAMARFAPDVVLNCAAFHNVPRCEDEPEKAFRVNCIGVRDLARLCLECDARLVTFSTDYVFDGTRRAPYEEDACPRPLQVYGMTRLAGEHAACAIAPDLAIVIRTCGLYGRDGSRSKGGNFVDARVADALARRELEMSCDQTVCPTATEDLSHAVLQLVDCADAAPGIYHLVNEGECTWFDFTRAIFDTLGADAKLRPVDRHGLSGRMRRPLYSVLANRRARSLGITLPDWGDALKRYLRMKYPEHT